MTDPFDALRAALVAALDDPDDEPEAVRVFDALAWLAPLVAAVATPDPSARQRAVDALHRAWWRNPEHVGALGEARALLTSGPAQGLLRALHDQLQRPAPPPEAELGDALRPALDALADQGDEARDALIRADARASVAAQMRGFRLPFRSGS